MPAGTPTRPHEADSAVESLFERTAWGVFRFVGQSVATTWLAVVATRRVPRLVRRRDPRLAPPLSYLTAALFLSGVTVRLQRLVEQRSQGSTETLVNDLRETLLEASVARAAVMTFPSLLAVALVATTVCWLARTRRRFDRNPLFRICCYSAGLLYLGVTTASASLIACQASGRFTMSDVPERAVLGVFLFVAGLAAWILAVGIAQHARRGWVRWTVIRYTVSIAASVGFVLGGGVGLEASFNVDGAERLGRELDRAGDREGLKVDVVQWAFHRAPNGEPDHVEATLTLSNLDDEPMVVPRPETLEAYVGAVRSDESSDSDWSRSRLVASSLDRLETPALVVPSGETRLMWLRLAPAAELTRPKLSSEQVRYDLPYSKSSGFGYFHATTAELWLPTPMHLQTLETASGSRPQSATRR